MGDLLYQYETIESMDTKSKQSTGFYSTEQEIQEPVSCLLTFNVNTLLLGGDALKLHKLKEMCVAPLVG